MKSFAWLLANYEARDSGCWQHPFLDSTLHRDGIQRIVTRLLGRDWLPGYDYRIQERRSVEAVPLGGPFRKVGFKELED